MDRPSGAWLGAPTVTAYSTHHSVLSTAALTLAGTPRRPNDRPTTHAPASPNPQRVGDSIKVAKHVVLVGGGPSGVETAAEIVCAFAGKQVTLVHGGERLLPALPPKAGAKAKAWLEAHRVKVGCTFYCLRWLTGSVRRSVAADCSRENTAWHGCRRAQGCSALLKWQRVGS